MIKVGVTGGIGSGKTTFCKVWEELGAFVVYADDFAKKLMNEDAELKSQIISVFGADSYTKEGELNRAYLAKEAFEKGRVDELNKLVHPVLWNKLAKLASEKEKEGVKIFLKEAAILLNYGRPIDLDYVILVDADKNLRAKRVSKRDKSEQKHVEKRMEAQKSFEELSPLCDFVVLNDGTEEELRKKAEKLFHHISTTG